VKGEQGGEYGEMCVVICEQGKVLLSYYNYLSQGCKYENYSGTQSRHVVQTNMIKIFKRI